MKEITKILLRFKALAKVNENRTSWQGIKSDYEMLETENFIYKLPVFEGVFNAVAELAPDVEWANEHFNERVGGEPLNPPPSHQKWNKDTEKFFMRGSKIFSHTYPERFWPKTIMPSGVRFSTSDYGDVLKLLNKDRFTRQAFLPIFFNEDITAALEGERVPCTIGYYFYVDDCGRLSCNYIIRSIDVIRHLHNDLYLAWLLMLYTCENIEGAPIRPGNLTLIAFNAHCFKNDEYTLDKRINNES